MTHQVCLSGNPTSQTAEHKTETAVESTMPCLTPAEMGIIHWQRIAIITVNAMKFY